MTGKSRGNYSLYLVIALLVMGIQGVLSGLYFSFALMGRENYFWILPILLLASLYLAAGISIRRRNKFADKLRENAAKFAGKPFWVTLWVVLFLLVFCLGVMSDKPFDLLLFFSIDRVFALVGLPLVLILMLLVEGLLLYYIFNLTQKSTTDESGKVAKSVVVKFILLVAFGVYLSRNLWRPVMGDYYRAAREISTYVMVASLIELLLQRFRYPISFQVFINWMKQYLKSGWLKLTILILIILGILIIIVGVTGLGITYDPKFWNAAGVPVLFEVIVFLAASLLFYFDVLRWNEGQENIKSLWKTLVIGAVIWGAAVLFWNGIMLPHTYFAPRPIIPNVETYPFSDAIYFDVGAQYVLLGEGVNNMVVTDRPMVMLLFSLFHFIAGQDYFDVIFVQICFLALIPVLLFLLGKRMHSIPLGISLAFVAIMKEAVAIRTASTIAISNVKVLMSELPTALLLVFFTYLIFNWFEGGKKLLYAFAAGGILGITVMVRANSLPLLFAVGVFSVLFFAPKKMWGAWFQTNLVFLGATILVLVPYSIQTYRITGTPFFMTKIMDVIDRSYSFSPGQEYGFGEFSSPVHLKTRIPHSPLEETANVLADNVFVVGNYYFHNLIMTFMSYPTLPGVAPIATLEEQPYWDAEQAWETQLTWYQWGMVGINLSVLAVGMAAAYKKWKWNGWTPLMVFLAYHLANAAARTTGGRYLVPVDWALHFYYVLGFFSIISFFASGLLPENAGNKNKSPCIKTPPNQLMSWGLLVIGFSLLGSAPVLVNLIPSRLPAYTTKQAVEILEEVSIPEYGDEISPAAIQTFLETGGGQVLSGLSLYPRFYTAGNSDAESAYVPDMPNDFQRVYFIVLDGNKQNHVNLPQDGEGYEGFPHGEQVMVVGCEYELYFDAYLVINLEDNALTAVRKPWADLFCNNDE